MVEISDAELEKWFQEEYLPNTPSLNEQWDKLNDDRKASRMQLEINRERNRRIESEASKRLGERIAENGEIPEDQLDSVRNEIRQEIIQESEQNQNLSNQAGETEKNSIQQEAPRAREPFTSDEWQQIINGDNTRFLTEENFMRGIDIHVLASMEKLPDNFDSLNNEEKADTVDRIKTELTPEERNEFNNRDIQAKQAILEVYPPKRLVDTDKWLEEAQNNAENDTLKQQIESSRKVIMDTMVKKIDAFANGETVVDQSNISDVYDGANIMLNYVEEKTDSDKVKANIKTSRDKLEAEIKIYDEANGFSGLSAEDAGKINETYARATKQFEKTQVPPEEYANLWDNIEFTDEKQREELISSFNEATLKQALRNAAVKNKGTKGKELDEAINAELHAAYTEQLFALIVNNETLKHTGDKNYTPEQIKQDANNAVASLMSGKKYKVDNKALVGNFALYTNNNMGYLNRLGTKIGKKAPVLGNMYNAVKKFDDTCIKRFNPLYGQTKSFMSAIDGNMGRQALNQAVRFGSQLLPGGNLVYGTYVAGQAIWRLGSKYNRMKNEAKKEGEKFSGWKFLRNHVGEIASSALLTAGAFIPGGNIAMGMGSAVVGSATNLIKSFKAAREKGNGFWKSIGKSVTSVGASVGTAVASSLLLGEAVEASGLGDFAAEHFSKTVPVGEYDPNNPNYSQNPVTDPAKINELKAMDPAELADKGYTFQNGVDKDTPGAFLIQEGKEGFTTRDYSSDELKYAETRNDGIRYSEYLDEKWVHPDYRDLSSSDPLAHSVEAHDNAIASLDKLAQSHKDMSSYVDGEFVSNSEMLLYKLYQANVLAPNPDAISDSGAPIGEVLSATDAHGNVVTYQDVFQKALRGGELNETDYEVISKVEDHVGGQYAGDTNDMGKFKDFNTYGDGSLPVDSYNAKADVGYEENIHPGANELYGAFTETRLNPLNPLPFGMVFDNQERGGEQLNERIGANAKQRAEEARKRLDDRKQPVVPIIPKEKQPVGYIAKQPEKEEPKEKPVVGYIAPKEEKPGYGKLLADEYKILYGVDPQVIDSDKPGEHRAYQAWINYNNRVDAERQATGRDIDMYDFLTERRQKFDEAIEKTGELKLDGKHHSPTQIKEDYSHHEDNPGMAAVVRGARQSLQQSNITAQNYTEQLTLSHFTDYVGHFVVQDELVSDGTRDISQNPQKNLKRDIVEQKVNPNQSYLVLDLNDYFLGSGNREPYEYHNNLPQPGVKGDRVTTSEVLKAMQTIAKRHPKQSIPAPQKGKGRG